MPKKPCYSVNVFCPECEKYRIINSSNNIYNDGIRHCDRCSRKLRGLARRGKQSSHRFMKDEVLKSGSIIHWSGPRSGVDNKKVNVTCGYNGCNKLRPLYIHRMNKYTKETNSFYCKKCAHAQVDYAIGPNCKSWKGGRLIDKHGYIKLHINGLSEEQKIYASKMCDKTGYIFEHRLNMAIYLKRILIRKEIVHHLNGQKDDNRISNLIIVTPETHKSADSTMWNTLKDEIGRLQKLLDAKNTLY